MKCSCDGIQQLEGNEAEAYANEHLRQVSVDNKTWEVVFECPETGKQWLMDYPESEQHGGGPSRLRALPIAD